MARCFPQQAAAKASGRVSTPPLTRRKHPMTKPKDGSAPSRLYDVRETADRLNVSTKTVRRLITNKKLPAHRVGRLVRIAEDDIQALLNHNRA
jgi:excisionase family DNA binding protein